MEPEIRDRFIHKAQDHANRMVALLSNVSAITRLEDGGDSGKDIVGGKSVVSIKNPNAIARGHTNALVHRVVHSVVRLGKIAEGNLVGPKHAQIGYRTRHGEVAESFVILFDDLDCTVGGAAVNDNVLDLSAALREHALKRRADYGG